MSMLLMVNENIRVIKGIKSQKLIDICHPVWDDDDDDDDGLINERDWSIKFQIEFSIIPSFLKQLAKILHNYFSTVALSHIWGNQPNHVIAHIFQNSDFGKGLWS